MPLKFEPVSVPLIGALDTKSAGAVVAPSDMRVLENAEYTKSGSVRHRAGYDAVELPPNVADSYADIDAVYNRGSYGLTARADELVYLGDRKISSYSTSTGRFEQCSGTYTPGWHTETEVAFATTAQTQGDAVIVNGIAVYAWVNAGVVRCAVVDESSGTVFTANYVVAAADGSRVSCLALGTGGVLIAWVDASTDAVLGRILATSQLHRGMAVALGAEYSVVGDLDATNPAYAVCPGPSDTGIIVWNADGTGIVGAGVGIATLTTAGVRLNSRNHSAAAGQLCTVAYNAAVSAVKVVTYDGTNLRTLQRGASTLEDLSAEDTQAVANVVRLATAGYGFAVLPSDTEHENFVTAWETSAADESNHLVTISAGPVSSSTTVTVRHAYLASEGLPLVSGRAGFVVGHASRTGLQNTYYLVDDFGVTAGIVAPGRAAGIPDNEHLGRWSATSTGYTGVLPFNRKVVTADTATTAAYTHQGILRVDWVHSGDVTSAEIGSSAYIGGNQLWQYDGVSAFEAGFHMFPDMLAGDSADFAQTVDGSGELLTGVSYNYRVYYEWHTDGGERIRSGAITRTVNMVATGYVTLTIPTLQFTNKTARCGRGEVAIVVYRSEGDSSTFWYRITDSNPANSTGNNRYIANSQFADSVQLVDRLADADITANEIDYQSNGEITHFEAPAGRIVCTIGPRLFVAGGALDPSEVHISLERNAARSAEFTGGVIAVRVGNSGPINGLAEVDETPIVLKDKSLYALTGGGITNIGSGSGYNVERIASDCGCIDPRTTVLTPAGLLFYTNAGWYQLGLGGTGVTYIGAPVEAYNSQEFVAAHAIPGTTQVYLVTAEGRTLAYDYFYSRWATFTNHAGVGATVWGRTRYAYLRDDNRTFVRNTAVYTDAGNAVNMKFRTGAFKLDTLQSWFKCRKMTVLGEYKSPHVLRVRVFRNRDAYPIDEFVWYPDNVLDTDALTDSVVPVGTENGYLGGDIASVDYQFSHKPLLSRYQEISFEFEDLALGTPGACCELTEVVLSIAPLNDAGRTSADRRF